MAKKMMVGTDSFDKIFESDGYYVDKTEIIYDLVENTSNEVTLFTRPRRFGKTLTMSMMESFFDIRRDSRDFFKDRNIFRNHPEFCAEWMNQYPTLFLSLKDVEGLSFEAAYSMLESTISRLCIKYEDLAEREQTNSADRETFMRLMHKKASLNEIKSSLDTLMRMMNMVYGKPVILLIDEYDVPLSKAADSKNTEFYSQMLDVMRGLLSISLKTNEYLKFAVITGCLRISKESIFTGVNNFACYSVTNKRFSQYFGFTADEVSELLNTFELSDKLEIIRKWYDGYIFGNTEIFCPWDVVSYVSSMLSDEAEQPQNFWADTSSNSILDEFVGHSRFDVSDKFERLLNGGTVTESVCDELTYDNISDSEKNLWSVLLMTGYVSKADVDSGKDKIKLRIPNAEIADLFKNAVIKRFEKTLDTSKVDAFVAAMWNKDTETASKMLSDILWNSISYFDYGEDYYHGMLNGIFSARGFSPDSNDEAGLGRLDLRVRDKANRTYLLLEFKRSKNESDLDSDCDDALAQIKKNGYDRVLLDGYEQQIVYGIAFYGKTARVKLKND